MAEYLIPKSAVIFEEEIKKSRFITYLQHTEGLEQAKAFWAEIKAQHPNARHHCWAAVAGKPPMLSALQGSQVGEISAVVVRYYGGILLGTGGLVRAYGNGVQQALKLLETERKVERQLFQVHCDYAQLNWIQILCEQHQIEIYQQDFQVQITLQLGISEDQIKPFEQALIERSAGTLKLEEMN